MKSTLLLLKAVCCLLLTTAFIEKSFGQAGTLDASFGNGGKDTLTMLAANEKDPQKEQIQKILIQKDQKIVAAGFVHNESVIDNSGTSAIALARYNSDGSLDRAFGKNGKVLNDTFFYCNDAVLQSDDKIIVVGDRGDYFGNGYPLLGRFNKNGSVDSSFGLNGFLDTAGKSGNHFYQVNILSDNLILVIGQAEIRIDGVYNGYYSYIEKYLSNGKIDKSFGGNGRLILKHKLYAPFVDRLVVQPDDKFFVQTFCFLNDTIHFELNRLTSSGKYDLSFGDSGTIIAGYQNTSIDNDTINNTLGLTALLNNGKILTTGYNAQKKQAFFKKYNINGDVDQSFGINGKVYYYGIKLQPTSILIQPDGKIILSGEISTPLKAYQSFAIARFNSDGKLDSNFGNDGLTITDFNARSRSYCAALQKDNKILVGGYCDRDSVQEYEITQNFAIARYNTDAVLPVSFISFNATKQRQSVLLNWQTADEINNNYFSVERSNNNKNFSEINKVYSTNDPAKINSYNSTDLKPMQGYNYYRLKQVDKDGKFSYSSVASVFFDGVITVTVHPNPANNFIYVDGLKENVQAKILITDINGKPVITTRVNRASQKINIQRLAKGMYNITILQNGETIKQKFMKQ